MFLPGFKLPYTTIYLRVGCNDHAVFYRDTPLIGKDEHFSWKAVVFNTQSQWCASDESSSSIHWEAIAYKEALSQTEICGIMNAKQQ